MTNGSRGEVDKLLDRVGCRLLTILQTDARISFQELARRVNLSPPAVAERVRRLEQAGVIKGYRTEVDPAKLGFTVTAFVHLSTTSDRKLGVVAAETAEILECHRVTGRDSFILKVVTRSVTHLEEIIDQLMRYGDPTTAVVLSTPVQPRSISLEDR